VLNNDAQSQLYIAQDFYMKKRRGILIGVGKGADVVNKQVSKSVIDSEVVACQFFRCKLI